MHFGSALSEARVEIGLRFKVQPEVRGHARGRPASIPAGRKEGSFDERRLHLRGDAEWINFYVVANLDNLTRGPEPTAAGKMEFTANLPAAADMDSRLQKLLPIRGAFDV